MSHITFKAIPLAVSLLLAGCAGITANQNAQNDLERLKRVEAGNAKSMLERQREDAKVKSLVEDAALPFIGKTQIPAPKMVQWPPSLRRDATVTLAFSDNLQDKLGNAVVMLPDLAHQIYLATGVPVRIKQDALRDADGKPVFVTLPGRWKGSLPEILDQLVAKNRVYATYENGALEFFRTQTRSFMIAVGNTDTDIDMGADSGGGEGGFSSKVSAKSKGSIKSGVGLLTSIKKFLSKGTELVFNDATGTVTITDTPDVLDAVAAHIDRENRIMGREIAFDVTVIRYSHSNRGTSGLDWNIVYRRLQDLSGGVVSISSPVAPVGAGDASFSVTSIPGVLGAGRWTGSSLLVEALNEVGSASVVSERTVSTLNRKPLMAAYNKTFDYVNETTASTTLAGVAVGQKTKQENEGRTLMLVPAVKSETEAQVEVAIRESVKNPFGTNTVGSGQSQQTVQLLDKDTELIRQTVNLKNGETRVLASVGRVIAQGSNRTLDRNASVFLGGSATGTQQQEQYFLVVSMRFVK